MATRATRLSNLNATTLTATDATVTNLTIVTGLTIPEGIDVAVTGAIEATTVTTTGAIDGGADITATGDLIGVNATLSGDLGAVGATLSGNLGAVDGTFSGNLAAVDGTLSGNLGAVDATLSGDLAAVGGAFSGNVSAVNGTFTGTLTQDSKLIANTFFATANIPAGATATDWDGLIFVAPIPCKVVSVRERHAVAGNDVGAVTVMLKKVPSATAKGSGTDCLSAGINLKAAADTNQSGSLHATPANYTLAVGDALGLVLTGTPTTLNGVTITVELQKVTP